MTIKQKIKLVILSPLLFTITINIFLAFLALISGSLAARLLGVSGRGELAAIQLWPTFLAGLSMLGLSDAIVYYTAKEPLRSGTILVSAMAFTLLISVPFWVLGYFLIPYLLTSQSSEVIEAARMYLLLIPLFSLISLPLQSLRGKNDFLVWNWARIIQPLGWIFILTIMIIMNRNTAREVAFVYLGFIFLISLPIVLIVLKRISGHIHFEINLWKPMLRFGLPSFAASLPVILNLRLDQFLMAAVLSSQALGYYVVAVAWASAISPLVNSISIIIFPKVASQTTIEEKRDILIQGTHLALLLSASLAFFLSIITPIMIPIIFGADFKPAINVSLILILAGVPSSIISVLESGVRGLGKPIIVFIGEFLGLIATVLCLSLMLKPFGIIGAAIASLLGYSTILIALTLIISRNLHVSVRKLLFPNRFDITLILSRVKNFRNNVA